MPQTMTFNQVSTLLNEINQQMSGAKTIAPVNTTEFISMATTMLQTGYDPLTTAISQVLSRTLFSVRPYTRKFSGLYRDSVQWGNHVRKLQVIDRPADNDNRFTLADGASIDQQKVCKPKVLQTNFYGGNVYQRCITIYKDQLDCAFTSPDEFGRFVSMLMQNVSDMIEKDHENMARLALVNFIGAKIKADPTNVIHLVTEYNDVTGLNLTSDTVKQPENFVPFFKWAWARIKTLSDRLTERSVKYHMNITDKPVARHTPIRLQKLYMYSDDLNNMAASVISGIFHDEFFKSIDYEAVNYWQSLDTPNGISITPNYIDANGVSVAAPEAVVQSNILAVLFDVEAIGITSINQWSAPAPFNASGGYTNTFWHYTDRYFNDLTENGLVFLMD